MELADYLRILRAYWKELTAAVLLGVLFAAVWSIAQPRVYTAEASGFVAAPGGGDLGSSMVGDQLARSKVRSYVDLGSWRTVAQHAVDELGLTESPEAVASRVKVTNPTDTVILRVSATGSTPESARDLAEEWIRGMISEIARLEGVDGQEPAVQLFAGDSARLPTAPSSPNVKLNLALGALIGALIGGGYAVVREWLDRRIRSAEGVEKATGVSVVGALPVETDPETAGSPLRLVDARDTDRAATAEAFRGLRTNLQYMSVDDPPRAIVVTSSLPGDGKSFTAVNLALTLAATGQRTILVDADLRRPLVAATLGLLEDAGLSDVLASRGTVADLLQQVDGAPNLGVLAAGPIPPNPSELVGSERMHRLIQSLGKEAMVVIDSPPLLPVTDAALLATKADGALVVVSTGKTTYEILGKALDNLTKANGKPLGIVMNKVPRTGAGALYYGYQYTADHYAEDGAKKKVPASR